MFGGGTSARALTMEEWLRRREGTAAASGVPVTMARALGLSALWCGVKVISEAVGMMPLVLYRKGQGDRVRERADSHPLYPLFHDEPNAEHTRPVFFETLQSHCLLYGNGYAEIERNGDGTVAGLWPIHPTRVKPERNQAGEVVYRVRGPQQLGGDVVIPARDMIHVPGLGPDGSVGWQLLEIGRDTLGFALAAQLYGSSWFKNAARPGGVIEVPGALSDQARENLRKSWQQLHAGVDKVGMVAVLEEGSKFTPVFASNEQTQYKDLLPFLVYEVARLLNCPPSKIHSLEKATWGNLETLNQDFLTTTLQPWLTKWECELKRKCLTSAEKRTLYPEFLTDVIVRLNYQTRVDGLVKLSGGPVYTVNEVRKLENMPAIEGGDVLRNPAGAAVATDPEPTTAPTTEPNPNTSTVPTDATLTSAA